jgi:hypothetical protein
VQATEDQKSQDEIARQQEPDPARREFPHRLEQRRCVEPAEQRNACVQEVPRQEIAGKAEQPFQHSERLYRPDKEQRILEQSRGLPVAALVPCSVPGIIHARLQSSRSEIAAGTARAL